VTTYKMSFHIQHCGYNINITILRKFQQRLRNWSIPF